MKDGFKSIIIEPFDGYLDFYGPINAQKPNTNSRLLKGDICLELTKAIKVKRATIKFKGSSRICYQNTVDNVNIDTPILPKLKLPLLSTTTTLGPGEVVLPWEIEIDNIYPASVMIKRANIHYKVELNFYLGLNRTIKAEYPIIIRRHLLPCLEMAPLVPTKLYTKTISTKFHYEIEAPRIVCVAQETIPVAIKLLAIGSQKRVLSIRTQLIQVELYRCNALSKSDADMTKFKSQLSGQKNTSSTTAKKGETNKYAKYSKKMIPAIVHTLDETQPMLSSQPLLLRHPLGEYLTMGLESPLAAIYHQLEIVFQFGAKFEDIRAKVPILVTSAGKSTESIPLPLYPYEKLPVMEPLFVSDENRLEGQSSTSLRIPTPTPSSYSSETTTGRINGEDEEVNGILEIMAGYNATPDQPIRRVRSAANLTVTAPNNDNDQSMEEGMRQSLKTPPRHRQLIVSDHTTSRSKQLAKRNTMEVLSGMWPRPETEVPHQWRRRQSSINPPYLSTENTPQRPIKDTRRKWAPPIVTASPTMTPLQNLAGLRAPTTTPQRHSPIPFPSDPTPLVSPPMDEQLPSEPEESPIDASESSFSSSSYMDTSFSSISPTSFSSHEPQSRPSSPSFPPAPGLPPFITLRPQTANPIALLEESFVLSPGSSVSTPVTSYYNLTDLSSHHDALQYAQGFTRNGGNGLVRTSDRLSILSTTQSSILDPDEEMIEMMQAMETRYRQQSTHHYAYARLPPIPNKNDERRATAYYADSDDESIYDSSSDTSSSSASYYPSIAVSPLPPAPAPPPPLSSSEEPVCLCPKHGIIVPRRL